MVPNRVKHHYVHFHKIELLSPSLGLFKWNGVGKTTENVVFLWRELLLDTIETSLSTSFDIIFCQHETKLKLNFFLTHWKLNSWLHTWSDVILLYKARQQQKVAIVFLPNYFWKYVIILCIRIK